MASLEQIRWSAERNLARVDNLVDIYTNKLGGTGSGRKPVNSTDVLRAAVVLLHSTLEDFLRDLARLRLPLGSEEALNNVPLAGTQGRTERFYLGRLSSFRDRSVDQLIKDSINEYLDRFTVNNTVELEKLLERIEIRVEGLSQYYPYISQLMERRHHIVHQADKNEQPGSGHHQTKSIGTGDVNSWIWAVRRIIQEVGDHLGENNT